MQLSQLDAWMKLAISYIPQIVFLIAAIMVVRKHRQWFVLVLAATAALNILLPVSALLVQTSIRQRVIELQPQMQNLKTQQEVQQLVAGDATIQNYSTLKEWLGQGIFLATLVFAVVLLLTLRFFMQKMAGASAQPAVYANGTSDRTPDGDASA